MNYRATLIGTEKEQQVHAMDLESIQKQTGVMLARIDWDKFPRAGVRIEHREWKEVGWLGSLITTPKTETK